MSKKAISKTTDFQQVVRAEIRAALADLGPVLARIAAADTIHTTERPETVLDRAVKEGRLAAEIMKGGAK